MTQHMGRNPFQQKAKKTPRKYGPSGKKQTSSPRGDCPLLKLPTQAVLLTLKSLMLLQAWLGRGESSNRRGGGGSTNK